MSNRDNPLKLGATIGILGGGQLGRMLALAAAPLGFRCHVFCPTTGPAFDVCARGFIAPYDDYKALAEFGQTLDVVTYEFENVTLPTVNFLSQYCPVRPNPNALQVSQDRLTEKHFLKKCGAEVADFMAVDSPEALTHALSCFNGKGVLKTRRLGYDGKGQIIINADTPLASRDVFSRLGNVPLILEAFIDFSLEVSVIAARGIDGTTCSYDLVENRHENHVLKSSTVPTRLDEDVAIRARKAAETILIELDYVGTMGVEFFVVESNGHTTLLVNEIAPRVHNSGHWTMNACSVSQFEQHIRAIAGWSLKSTKRHADVVMTNLLGDEINCWPHLIQQPDTYFHNYAKNEARPGRKMGHINLLKPLSTHGSVG